MEATETNTVNHWEELRRCARQYESELDKKIFSFSKLITSRNSELRSSAGLEAQPLLGSKDNFERLSCEIDTLLTSLQDVNNQMAQYCQQMPSSNAIVYTFQRHQDILKDYSNDFHKTRANIEQQMNRDELMQTVRKKDMGEFSFSSHSRKSDFLLKENEHIRSSEIMIDDQINIAMRTRDTLRNQRSAMKSIQTQLTTLANKFPMLNNVMHRIGVKKRKDSIILACVIGICLFLLLIYIF